MNASEQAVAGSPTWQIAFLSFAAVLILFEIVRGWRLGLFRQLVRVAAVVAAYASAFFGGRLLVPLVRPFLKIPDLIIGALAGVVLALVVYCIITTVGNILFKRTGQQESAIVRFFYGITGATLGIVFGAFLVWLTIVGIRSIGTVAEAQVKGRSSNDVPPRDTGLAPEDHEAFKEAFPKQPDTQSLVISLARLKNSIELGELGEAVKQADIIPETAYETLDSAGQILATPESAQRFLSFPGARELSEDPKIVALRDDPEITDMIMQGRFLELIQNQRIIEAANDASLAAKIKRFDLRRALEHAGQRREEPPLPNRE